MKLDLLLRYAHSGRGQISHSNGDQAQHERRVRRHR